MAIAEKYRVRRNLTFNGRTFERGDAISRSYIVQTAPEKEGSLLRTGYIEPAVAPTDYPDALSDLTKADLMDYAETLGVQGLSATWRKAEIIEAIQKEL